MKRLGLILILTVLITSMMAIKYEEEKLRIPHAEKGFTEEFGIELVFPQFESEFHAATLEQINGRIVELNNDMCADYIRSEQFLGPGKLRNEYEIAFLSEDFISLALTYTFDFSGSSEDPEEEDEQLWFEKFHCYNFDLKTGNKLIPEDCFKFVGDDQEWTEFVVNNDECMNNNSFPIDFICDSSTVGFQFEGCENMAMFFWEDLEPFFEVKGLEVVRE